MLKKMAVPLLAIVFISAGPVCGEKISIDPNRGPAVGIPAASQAEDRPIDKKISYDGVHVRLYNVIDDLSATSGVKLHCGKSSSDWKVRELPVLVCSRDLPLSVLLQALADSTHLLFSQNRVDDVVSYRIWRDSKRENELAAIEESRKAAIGYDWDILSLSSNLPESSLEDGFARNNAYPEENRLWAAEKRFISKAIAELGPKVRDRVIAGELVVLSYKYAPESVKPYIKSAFQSGWKACELYKARIGQEPPGPFDEERLNECYIKISADSGFRDPNSGHKLDVALRGSGFGYQTIDASEYEPYVRKNRPDLPQRPEVSESDLKIDALGKRYIKLSVSDGDDPSFLDTKIKIPPLKDGAKPGYSELLYELSKAAGYSVIAEWQAARYIPPFETDKQTFAGFFGRDVTPREVLKCSTEMDRMDWYVDEEHKLILGRDKGWTNHLKALVPEKLLQDMSNKVKGNGVELDDLEPLAGLSWDQIHEWIGYCPEYPELCRLGGSGIGVSESRLWRLYFTLSGADRALAKEGRSVSLANYDRSLICSAVRGEIAMQMIQSPIRLGLSPVKIKIDTLTDPNDLPDLTLRIEKNGEQNQLHTYFIHLDGQDDHSIHMAEWLPGAFPYKQLQAKP